MDPSHPSPPEPATSRDRRAHGPLGPALRRAWVGYQRQLDGEMAAAGFDDRKVPDGRVLRICRRSPGTTISQIGRELGMSRQGAGAIVADLRERGYVAVEPSPTSGRESSVTLTPRAESYLAAHRKATRTIDARLRRALGPEGFDHLRRLVEFLAGDDEEVRLRDYLRSRGVTEL